MEPPPAPTVRTSTDGRAHGRRRRRVVSRPIRGAPSWTSATSVDVPPMSKVSRFVKPACSATQSAPETPPAGPLHQQVHRGRVGRGDAGEAAVGAQDVQLRARRSPACPQRVLEVGDVARRPSGARRNWRPWSGCARTPASPAGSRWRSETGTPGSSSRDDLGDALLVGAVGEGVDQRDGQRLDALLAQVRAACRAGPASSSWRRRHPSAPMRSIASTVFSSAASGSGFGQIIQPPRPPGTKERAICSTWR